MACKPVFLIFAQTRYRDVPTFGSDTIRMFSHNVSELKQLAARDYEDILQVSTRVWSLWRCIDDYQCAIPVFEGLLPDHEDNAKLIHLLFILAYWHGLAKLRIHTDKTIAILQEVTKIFGAIIRDFKATVCCKFQTKELSREANARIRRQAVLASRKVRCFKLDQCLLPS